MDDSQSTGAGGLLAGRYRLTEAIGRGGMGRVWRAQDELLNRTVAVKELTAGQYATEAEREVLHRRTRTEARAAARISHPNVVTVHDVLEHDGRPWIVMQYVDGRSLSDAVKESGPVPAREAARIGVAVLGALRAAHAAGVLHRDVKPANVMLARDGHVLLADFGIAAVEGDASVTRTGELIGSVEYLAPERVRGSSPGPESDLWSLGATLYTAVQGVSPYHRDSALSTLQAVIVDEAPYPTAAEDLGPVIVAMLRKEPGERPAAQECARMLADVAQGRGAGTRAYPAEGPTAPVAGPYGARSGTHAQHPQAGTHVRQPLSQQAQQAQQAQQTGPYQQHPAPPASGGPQQAGTHVYHQGAGDPPGTAPRYSHDIRSAHPGATGPTAGQAQAGPYGPTGPYAGVRPYDHPGGGGPGQGPVRGDGGGRRGSRGRTVVLAVVAAVVLGGGIGYGVTQFGGSSDGGRSTTGGTTTGGARADGTHKSTTGNGGTRQTGGTGGSSPEGGASPGDGKPSDDTGTGGGQSLPDGWQRVDAPEGFSIWLPKGYVRVQGVSTIDYSPDNDQHFVRISIDPQPDFPTPLDHLQNLEGSGGKVGGLPDYHRMMLRSDTYRDQKLAARWEFTWTQGPSQGPAGPRTAADLMYVDGDTGTEYAVYMSGPTADWDESSFSTVLRGWQPPDSGD
ncbi:serine/threonine-protein kinase [Streptomyces fuscigenes]|uniref:serine/threonine-protein kinase n=1 Tax=Streptomyces fuscigenes TaxID=1528880 RepID=UPI001F2087ED|nr:serine/threonine-protein kinase [Streptomyces fuscigenes]MCF3964569.1 serine/threonine protein kinase [Streptomyces fuscigenes]